MTTTRTSLLENIRYVFLDRDGVINRKMPEGQWVTSSMQFVMLDGVAAAIASLNRAKRKVLVITNQRGIALGLFSEADLANIHQTMRAELAHAGARVDALYYCPHARDTCDCRKPRPGMFHQAFQEFPGATPENSLLIGDSLSDIQAGHHLGMPTVLIDADVNVDSELDLPENHPDERRLASIVAARTLATFCAPSLAEFVRTHFDGSNEAACS